MESSQRCRRVPDAESPPRRRTGLLSCPRVAGAPIREEYGHRDDMSRAPRGAVTVPRAVQRSGVCEDERRAVGRPLRGIALKHFSVVAVCDHVEFGGDRRSVPFRELLEHLRRVQDDRVCAIDGHPRAIGVLSSSRACSRWFATRITKVCDPLDAARDCRACAMRWHVKGGAEESTTSMECWRKRRSPLATAGGSHPISSSGNVRRLVPNRRTRAKRPRLGAGSWTPFLPSCRLTRLYP